MVGGRSLTGADRGHFPRFRRTSHNVYYVKLHGSYLIACSSCSSLAEVNFSVLRKAYVRVRRCQVIVIHCHTIRLPT